MAYVLQTAKSDTLNGAISAGATSFTLTSGNFGSPSGTQLYVIDYDVPASLEVVSATVAGTAGTSVVRGLDGTTGVTHASSAKVLAAFVPSHYTQLGPLAASDSWTAWVPTFAGFSVDPAIVSARYFQVGKLVWFYINMGQGTSNATTFTFTLPVAAKTANIIIGTGNRTDNGADGTVGAIYSAAASTTATVRANIASGAWTNTGGKSIIASGFYEAN